jgi:alkylhydroperoxidase family enzyme
MGKVPEALIQAVRDGLPLADAKLQALRHFTEVLVERRGWAPESEVEAFRAAGYSPRQIIEVVAFVSHKTLSNYLNHLAETPLDAAFAPLAWTGAVRA